MFNASGGQVATSQPTTLYTYDGAGNLQTVIEPDGQTTTTTAWHRRRWWC
jgi:YD repeat-containing protein